MKTAEIKYLGNLRTSAEHLKSSQSLITDAPTDNNGKGEYFSPTDLVATAMVSCMITVMGILAEKNEMSIGTIEGDVEKIMGGPPRRIIALNINISFSKHNLSDTDKQLLEKIALNCPVEKSIHPDIATNVKFSYS